MHSKMYRGSRAFEWIFLSKTCERIILLAIASCALFLTLLAWSAISFAAQNKEKVSSQDDAWYVKQLLVMDGTTGTAKWIFDILDNEKKHPLVKVAFVDEAPFVFATRFDFAKKQILFQVDRTFIRASDPGTTSLARRDMARLQFVREAALAMFLEQPLAYDIYRVCADAVNLTPLCFQTLVTPHMAALTAQWDYAKKHDLTRVFPESIGNNRDEFIARGASPADAESAALFIYGAQGHFRNLFWADRYGQFLDE